MISELVLAIGLVAAFEGLVLALAPKRMEDALRIFAAMSPEARRLIGLGTLTLGIFIIWIARNLL